MLEQNKNKNKNNWGIEFLNLKKRVNEKANHYIKEHLEY